jgi:hypothetical protein
MKKVFGVKRKSIGPNKKFNLRDSEKMCVVEIRMKSAAAGKTRFFDPLT